MKKKRVAVLVLTMAMLAGEAMGAAGCGAKETQTEQAAEGTEARKQKQKYVKLHFMIQMERPC